MRFVLTRITGRRRSRQPGSALHRPQLAYPVSAGPEALDAVGQGVRSTRPCHGRGVSRAGLGGGELSERHLAWMLLDTLPLIKTRWTWFVGSYLLYISSHFMTTFLTALLPYRDACSQCDCPRYKPRGSLHVSASQDRRLPVLKWRSTGIS